MGCVHADENITICRPTSVTARRILWCPTCGQRRRTTVDLFVWYDPLLTCCSCGDRWEGGERLPRPFERGWRAKSTARARRAWEAGMRWSDALAAMRDVQEAT